MSALGIPLKTITEPDGAEKTITPVELVYGDPFDPQKLPSEFFWSFETSLDKMDDQQLILYFGRTKRGIDQLQETVEQAQTILRHLFSGWILSLDISEADGEDQWRLLFCQLQLYRYVRKAIQSLQKQYLPYSRGGGTS